MTFIMANPYEFIEFSGRYGKYDTVKSDKY